MKSAIRPTLAAMAALVVSTTHATDGVIEINHAKIMANGGYPYTISQPGSYRLTSNLTQPDVDTVVININTDHVQLDLNGFTITGPGASAAGIGYGIYAGFTSATTIRNGSFIGIAAGAISVGGVMNVVEDVQVDGCGGTGISLNWNSSTHHSGTVRRSHVRHCGSGIYSHLVSDSLVFQNSGYGISGVKVLNSRALYNGGTGISVSGAAIDNVIADNSGNGLDANGVVSGNSIRFNAGFGINTGTSGQVIFTQNSLESNTAGTVTGSLAPHSLPPNSNLCNGSPC